MDGLVLAIPHIRWEPWLHPVPQQTYAVSLLLSSGTPGKELVRLSHAFSNTHTPGDLEILLNRTLPLRTPGLGALFIDIF